jgi:hypothetical protein
VQHGIGHAVVGLKEQLLLDLDCPVAGILAVPRDASSSEGNDDLAGFDRGDGDRSAKWSQLTSVEEHTGIDEAGRHGAIVSGPAWHRNSLIDQPS